jgi:hypothetical protein
MPQGLDPVEELVEPGAPDDQTKLRTAAALLPSDGLVAFCWVRVFAYCNSKLNSFYDSKLQHSVGRDATTRPESGAVLRCRCARAPSLTLCVCVCVCVCACICL